MCLLRSSSSADSVRAHLSAQTRQCSSPENQKMAFVRIQFDIIIKKPVREFLSFYLKAKYNKCLLVYYTTRVLCHPHNYKISVSFPTKKKPFKNMFNRSAPKAEPYGNSLNDSRQELNDSLILTHYFLFRS